MARDFFSDSRLPAPRPKGVSATRTPSSGSVRTRAEHPAVAPAIPAAASTPNKSLEHWFWGLLELSWSDLWQRLRLWESRLRPESPRLAGIWFIAWSVTGLSGVLLLLSLLTEPSPRTGRGKAGAESLSLRAPVTLPVHPADELPADEEVDPSVIPAVAYSEQTAFGEVERADFVAEPITIPGASPTAGDETRADHLAETHSNIIRHVGYRAETSTQDRVSQTKFEDRSSPPVITSRSPLPRQTANGIPGGGVPEVFRVRPVSAPAQSSPKTLPHPHAAPSHDSSR